MNHLDILLPFGLPPAEFAADLSRELKAPALATLAARAQTERRRFDEFSRALPHEAWIARQFGFESAMHADSSPPVASAAMRALGILEAQGTWFIVNPVHFHIARDHLVLTDPRQLRLSERESRALFDAARPLFEEAGKTLLYGDANTWFARADDWERLQTSTPDAAAGHNIDIWMPKGEGERNWRKLQNEVQMHWFTHPVNSEREARGDRPVNSIWLWAGAPASTARLPSRESAPYGAAFNLDGWMRALVQSAAARAEDGSAPEIVSRAPERSLVLLGALLEPALANDWPQWLAALNRLEADWFAPLLGALKEGKIDRLTLVATDHVRLSAFGAGRQSLRKFWVKPSLEPLLT